MRCFHLFYASQKQSESSLLKDVGKLSCTNLYDVSVNPNTHYYYFFSSSRPFNLEGGKKDLILPTDMKKMPMPLKPINNNRSVPDLAAMRRGIRISQWARGKREHLPPDRGQCPVRGALQRWHGWDAGTKLCAGIKHCPYEPSAPPLPCPHHPGHRKADGGQEDLTTGWHRAGRKCQHPGTLATE